MICASDVMCDYVLEDDCRSRAAVRAWGCRRARPASADARPRPTDFRCARVTTTALRTMARLPHTAVGVDPAERLPKRHAGGHTFLRPHSEQYHYYKRFGNAGRNALSSDFHNFPGGCLPRPATVYSAGPTGTCPPGTAGVVRTVAALRSVGTLTDY